MMMGATANSTAMTSTILVAAEAPSTQGVLGKLIHRSGLAQARDWQLALGSLSCTAPEPSGRYDRRINSPEWAAGGGAATAHHHRTASRAASTAAQCGSGRNPRTWEA